MKLKKLKKRAKNNLKQHLWHSIIVCFIVTTVISGGYKYNTIGNIKENDRVVSIENDFKGTNNFNIIENVLKKTKITNVVEDISNYKPTRGVLSVFFNQITGTGSIVIGILNAFNHFIFNNSIPILITISIGLLIYIVIYLFVQNILIVGKNRYFLEQRKYLETSVDKILFIYRVKKTNNVAIIMFKKSLFSFLWNLTIIGGIIKHYEYSMIPYLLAENPEMNSKECFKISKQITKNYKFQLFQLDISLIGWYILGGLTLGLSNIFYFNPYKESVYAEVYMELRNKHFECCKKYFKDCYLEGDSNLKTYPKEKYFIPETKRRKWLNIDYHHNYSITHLILFFFTGSIIGWIWEVSLHLFNSGIFVNRGTMFGPWLPIYGWGCIFIIILLKKFRDKPWLLFLLSFSICGIVEYSTAWYLETFKGMKWWDYSGYFLNLDGRICLEGLLVFGLGGCIFTYIIAPLLDDLYSKINQKVKIIIIVVLIVLFSCDSIYSHYYPNTGKGITTNIEYNSK